MEEYERDGFAWMPYTLENIQWMTSQHPSSYLFSVDKDTNIALWMNLTHMRRHLEIVYLYNNKHG
jgi:uncharacterized membrane protein (UPF0127 family)